MNEKRAASRKRKVGTSPRDGKEPPPGSINSKGEYEKQRDGRREKGGPQERDKKKTINLEHVSQTVNLVKCLAYLDQNVSIKEKGGNFHFRHGETKIEYLSKPEFTREKRGGGEKPIETSKRNKLVPFFLVGCFYGTQ